MIENISSQEEVVLLSVGSVAEGAYAYGLQKEIKTQLDQNWSLGTIHTILYRLENKGLLRSEMGGASDKRGGRSKRIYKLTAKGFKNLDFIQESRQMMWKNVKPSFQ